MLKIHIQIESGRSYENNKNYHFSDHYSGTPFLSQSQTLDIDDFHEDWATMWKVDHKEVIDRIKHMDEIQLFKQYDPLEYAGPVLNKLSTRFKLVIATSRRKSIIGDTKDWINQYFPGIF